MLAPAGSSPLHLQYVGVIGFTSDLLALELPSIAENVVGAQSVQNFIVKLYLYTLFVHSLLCS